MQFTKWQHVIAIIKCIVYPSMWLKNYEYSEAWNTKLISLMSEHKFTNITTYTATLGGVLIWISNHPYASFSPYGYHVNYDFRPSRKTIVLAKMKLDAEKLSLI